MQIMLDRRLDHYDDYGLKEPLLDNVPIRSNFLLLLEPIFQVQYSSCVLYTYVVKPNSNILVQYYFYTN